MPELSTVVAILCHSKSSVNQLVTVVDDIEAAAWCGDVAKLVPGMAVDCGRRRHVDGFLSLCDGKCVVDRNG